MKELVFLPDRDGRDEIGSAMGFVRIGAEAADLRCLAERLAAPAPEENPVARETLWRGVMALALLCDVWPGCGASLEVLTVDESASPFASWALAARQGGGEAIRLLVVKMDGKQRLLGIVDAGCGLRLPAEPSDWKNAAPERAAWIDPVTGEVSDPVGFLTERDRAILLERLEQLTLAEPMAESFLQALRDADEAEYAPVRRREESALEALAIRAEAVCGLRDFEALTVRREKYGAGGNALLRCLTGRDGADAARAGSCATWLWRGAPFAAESPVLGLSGVAHPEAGAVLNEMAAEMTLLSTGSVKWNARTGAALSGWLEERRTSPAFLPEARERIEASCRLLRENAAQPQAPVALVWPWDASSRAVEMLLRDALGEKWMQAAAAPFSDRLACLPGCLLGDGTLNRVCAWGDGVLLPPLSAAVAKCAAEEEGVFAPETLRFQPHEDGSITASFLLRGEGAVSLARTYAPEEICTLAGAEAPQIALWPGSPLEGWRAYHAFLRGGAELAGAEGPLDAEAAAIATWALPTGGLSPTDAVPVAMPALGLTPMDAAGMPTPAAPTSDEPSDEEASTAPWRCLRMTEFPAFLTLCREGLCLGALPNRRAALRPEPLGDVCIGVDVGCSRTTVAYAVNGELRPLEARSQPRMLVQPAAAPPDAFLTGLALTNPTPTAALLTGPDEALFTDGRAFRPASVAEMADMDASGLRARLKWRSDGDSVRARGMLLHQAMLTAALTAAEAGAESLSFRLGIPDEMGDEGREAMLAAARTTAEALSRETGLPLTAAGPAVSWAEESTALRAALKAEGPGRGSCVILDLGSGSIKMHLWLQNQAKPLLGGVVFEGVQDALLRAFRREPMALLQDFADCGNEALLQDVLALAEQLDPALAGPRQQDRLALMLDRLTQTHRIALGQHMNARAAAGQPTYTQSVLLETAAAALFASGLMLAQAGENHLLSHLLPDDLTLCLTGRGAWLMETLPASARSALQRLTHAPMRLDHPVRFISIRTAARAACVAEGLALMKEPGSLADPDLIRTRESFSALMLMLMRQLAAAFPPHMWRLHEGLFDWQTGALTPAGEDSIRRAAARCYDDGEGVPASVAAFVRTLRAGPIVADDLGAGV